MMGVRGNVDCETSPSVVYEEVVNVVPGKEAAETSCWNMSFLFVEGAG